VQIRKLQPDNGVEIESNLTVSVCQSMCCLYLSGPYASASVCVFESSVMRIIGWEGRRCTAQRSSSIIAGWLLSQTQTNKDGPNTYQHFIFMLTYLNTQLNYIFLPVVHDVVYAVTKWLTVFLLCFCLLFLHYVHVHLSDSLFPIIVSYP
jgi:hypothetical protein